MSVNSKISLIISEIGLIPKHVRFAISSIAGGLLLLAAVTVSFQYIFITLPIFIFLCYWLVWFAIYENINRVEWIMLFVLPVLWALEWYVFFYMIPIRWLTRLAFGLIFTMIFYVLLSVENIYNVGVEKNIQLQKAAITVSTVFLVSLCYIAFQVVASFEMYWLLSGAVVALISWIFALKYFWTVEPQLKFDTWQISMTNFVAFCMFFASLALTFVPFGSENTRPVILSGIFYLLTNSTAESRDAITFKQKSKEFLLVFAALVLILFVTSQK